MCVYVKITGRFLKTAAWSPRPHVKCGLNLQHTAGVEVQKWDGETNKKRGRRKIGPDKGREEES